MLSLCSFIYSTSIYAICVPTRAFGGVSWVPIKERPVLFENAQENVRIRTGDAFTGESWDLGLPLLKTDRSGDDKVASSAYFS